MAKSGVTRKSGEYLSINELSERKNLTVSFLRTAKDKYGLPYYKLGNLVRFTEADFAKWIASRKQVAS